VTGAGGKAFVAGADIAEMVEMPPDKAQTFSERGGSLGTAIETSSKPWIAAVNGFALGGGCELALACDFIYATDNAKFGQPEVKLGVIPGFGGTQRLARRVGVAKAKELCMTGDTIDAAEALRIGLCDAVFPGGELMAKVKAVAARIAANGPLAVAEVKRLVHVGQSMTLEASLAAEQKAFGQLFATADQREGMSAFLAKPKRTAAFKGQ
jgi:enoyl-CoA hydratase